MQEVTGLTLVGGIAHLSWLKWWWRPVQTASCSKARSIRVVASRTICRSSSVNSAARDSTIQAILGRSWIIHGVSRSPGRRSECLSRSSRPPQVGHLGAGVDMHRSMVRAGAPVHRKDGRGLSQRHHAHTCGPRRRRNTGRVPPGRSQDPLVYARELGNEGLRCSGIFPSLAPGSAASKTSNADSDAGQGAADPAEQQGHLFTRQRSQVQNLPRPPA